MSIGKKSRYLYPDFTKRQESLDPKKGKMQNIALFCSSGNQIESIYFDEAVRLGDWIGTRKKRLLYGGANAGLMEIVACAVKRQGGFVTGVITAALKQRGCASVQPDELIVVDTLSVRKQVMIERADIFVVLPGGIGTLDEMFDVLASAQLGYHDRLLVICNINGFFDSLLCQFSSLYSSHFAPLSGKQFYRVVGSAEECIDLLALLDQEEINKYIV